MNPASTRIVNQVIGIMVMAVVFILGASAQAESSKYIVRFKTPQIYKMQSQRFERMQAVQAQSFGSGIQLFNTSAVIERALNKVEMFIISSDNEADIARLRAHPAVADVEAEIFYPAPKPMVTALRGPAVEQDIETPWGILAIKADQAWNTTKGEQSRVLILDTGIDANHPDLVSRFEKGQDFTGGSNYQDSIGHGTHVAGTIAADGEHSGLVGVAPRTKILAGKVCSERGCGSTAIVSGIDWGIDQKVDVISMSLGGPLATPSQKRAVERADAARVVVVAASGNDGVRRISYPAAFPTVVAVGAVGLYSGEIKRAEFSQYGPGLSVVAPGVDVVSSVPRGAGRISFVSIDYGDGTAVRVRSASLQGAPENDVAITGSLVFAGLGKPDDIRKAALRGKFALIQRGEITFKEKVVNAMNAGATGVVIYNNVDGVPRGGLGEDSGVIVPVAMIEKMVGERLKDLVARGTEAKASIRTDKSDFDSYDGTSMATPHVSGVVALIRSAVPNLSPVQVRQVLEQSSTGIGNRDEYGAGLVDAAHAIVKAREIAERRRAAGL